MKAELSLPELLAIIEIVDEHVDRNFPGVDPPRVLRELQTKLDRVVAQHRNEIATVIRSSRNAQAPTTRERSVREHKKRKRRGKGAEG